MKPSKIPSDKTIQISEIFFIFDDSKISSFLEI